MFLCVSRFTLSTCRLRLVLTALECIGEASPRLSWFPFTTHLNVVVVVVLFVFRMNRSACPEHLEQLLNLLPQEKGMEKTKKIQTNHFHIGREQCSTKTDFLSILFLEIWKSQILNCQISCFLVVGHWLWPRVRQKKKKKHRTWEKFSDGGVFIRCVMCLISMFILFNHKTFRNTKRT